MKILCSIRNNSDGLFFDTLTKKLVVLSLAGLTSGVGEFYGLCFRNGQVVGFPGYSFVPTSETSILTYTLVGRYIERKTDWFLLVDNRGRFHNVSRLDAIQLSQAGCVSNTMHCLDSVRMKQGSVPMLSVLRERSSPEDTVSYLRDVSSEVNNGLLGTPGVGKKFFGKRLRDGAFGVVKYPVGPRGYDNVNEVLCFELGRLFGVSVCEASFETYRGNSTLVFSRYGYDIVSDIFVSCADAFCGTSHPSLEVFNRNFSLTTLESKYGAEGLAGFNRMVLFDLITRQEDRHIRNFAFVNSRFYPLYDNGRCLFWDHEDMDLEEWLSKHLGVSELFGLATLNEHGFGYNYALHVLGPTGCAQLLTPGVDYESVFVLLSKYYSPHRAKLLSRYIYSMYAVLTGGVGLG